MSQKLSSIMLQVRVRPPARQLHPKSGLPKSHAPGPGTLKKGLTVRGRQRFSGPGMSPGNGQENRVLITPLVRVKQGEAVKAHELWHALLENVRSVRLRATVGSPKCGWPRESAATDPGESGRPNTQVAQVPDVCDWCPPPAASCKSLHEGPASEGALHETAE